MPTFHIYLPNVKGTPEVRPVEGRKFKVTLAGAEFWLFAHQAHDMVGLYRISDVRSGRKVLDIPHQTMAANGGLLVPAAKAAWKKFMSGRNEKSVRAVFEAAPSIEEATAA